MDRDKRAFGKARMWDHLRADPSSTEKGASFFGFNATAVAVQVVAAILLWHFFDWLIGDWIAVHARAFFESL